MKGKNFVTFFLLAALLFSNAQATEALSSGADIAEAMARLHLLKGTDDGYDLEAMPTRIQGLVMLIRLMGAEAELPATVTPSHPFTDIDPWAQSYVQYAWEKQWIKGVGNGQFGAQDPLNEQQYTTLLLRVLGYSEEQGDFEFDQVDVKAEELGLSNEIGRSTVLDREKMFIIAWDVLQQPIKEAEITLAEQLSEKAVFSSETYGQLVAQIRRPERVSGLVKEEDIKKIAEAYGRRFDEVKRLFQEMLRQAKSVDRDNDIQGWVRKQIELWLEEVDNNQIGTYCDRVLLLWADFWDEVEGKTN